ncbi:putative pre-16S rRNA nuclease isoform X4 [Gossypium hirsutum]|nr:putative pre-16S rRNA nuclease isoform X4 [Gossypium hirsutum]
MAEREEVDEFIIGIPKSWDGKETPQSNKVRSIAGRLAVRAAERGWRVYLQDEHGTSSEAAYRMINLGLNKSARQKTSDAYAAVILLERYFAISGEDIEIVLPKQIDLQEKLRKGRRFKMRRIEKLAEPSKSPVFQFILGVIMF